MKIVAVITANNEQETIAPLVTALFQSCDEVIVVNDGSTDNTGERALLAGAYVIPHYERKGIGASLMQAWTFALEHGADKVLQIDAGGSHFPEHAFILTVTDADITIGSRFCQDAYYQGRNGRKFLSWLYAKLCNFAIGSKVASDWTSGYRCFTRKAIETLLEQPDYWTNMHTWQAEILHRAACRKLTITERPILYLAGASSLKSEHISDAILILLKVATIR